MHIALNMDSALSHDEHFTNVNSTYNKERMCFYFLRSYFIYFKFLVFGDINMSLPFMVLTIGGDDGTMKLGLINFISIYMKKQKSMYYC